MRSFLTYGLISLVGVSALYACGDDSGDGTTPGIGGSAGMGGRAGAGGGGAGTAGMGGAAGAAAGSGGSAGGGGVPVAPAANCTGCVQLSLAVAATPFNAMGTQVGYIFSAAAPAAPFDLSAVTTITWRVQALTANALYYVQPILQNGPPEDPAYAFGSYGGNVALAPAAFAAGAWVDVSVNVAALAGGSGADAGAGGGADAGDAGATPLLTAFDKSKTRAIGLNIGAGPTAGAGIVSVEIDSLTVTGTSNFTTKTFTADVEGLTLNNFQMVPNASPPAFR